MKRQLLLIAAKLRTLHQSDVVLSLTFLIVLAQLVVVVLNNNPKRTILGLQLDNRPAGQLEGSKLNQKVREEVVTLEGKRITVVAANYSTKVTSRQLGTRYDDASIRTNLLQAGRSGSWWQRLKDQDLALFGRRNIQVGYGNISTRVTSQFLTTLDHKISTTPTSAYFELQNQTVQVHPDAAGISVNKPAAEALIRAANSKTDRAVVPTITTAAPISAAQLQPLVPQVKNIVSQPLVITADTATVTLSPSDLVALVEPKQSKESNAKTVTVSFNDSKLNATVDKLLQQAEKPAQPRLLSGSAVVSAGSPGLQAEGDHPKVQVLATLLKRQAGVADQKIVAIKLVKIDPPVVQTVPAGVPLPRASSSAHGPVYLTIDDGPGTYTEALLNILKKYNVHAVFYLIGRNVQSYPGTVQRIVREGHKVGNHSFTHSDLSRLSAAAVQKELTDTQAAIKQACGVTPTDFRPPYGAQNATVRNIAASMGLADNLWSVDPRDWAQPGAAVIAQRTFAGLQPGAVILLHVLHQQTVDALPSIIEGIRARGYTLN